MHTHEVYFRDTALGFLVWSVSLVITTAFLASAPTSMVAGNAARNDAGTTAAGAAGSDPYGYFVDSLFRSDRPAYDLNDDSALHAEVGLILARGLREGYVPSTDRAYLAQRGSANRNGPGGRAAPRLRGAQPGPPGGGQRAPGDGSLLVLDVPGSADRGFLCELCSDDWRQAAGQYGVAYARGRLKRIRKREEIPHAIDTTLAAWCADSHHHPDRPLQPLLEKAFQG